MQKRPAFLFYHYDWLRDTSVRMLTPAERGIYVDILCHSFQRGGKLWLRTGGGTPTLTDLSRLLGIEDNLCRKTLDNLVRLGCLVVDEEGVYYNPRQLRDVEIADAKSQAGRVGGMRSKNTPTGIANLKNVGSKMQAASEATSEAISEAESEGSSEAKRKQDRNISVSVSDSLINTLSLPRGEKEESSVISPPPGMPKTEEEAVERAERVGVPDWFVRDKAYPQLLAMGYRDNGNLIRNYEYWVKLYYGNWDNKNRQKTGRQGRKTTCTQPTNEPGLPTL